MLNKFRWHSVALTADIEKGSLMIGISEHDQEMLRFLWFENPHEMDSKLIHLRFKRLPLGLCPSPSILGAIIAHHLNLHRKKFPDLVEAIENSMNVDDLLTGEKKTMNAHLTCTKMNQGGFHLRKWNSNSSSLLKKIEIAEGRSEPGRIKETATTIVEEEDESYVKATTSSSSAMRGETQNLAKLPAVIWSSQSDEFIFDLSEIVNCLRKLPVNERWLLKFTTKIFGPQGFLWSFVIRLKIMFQE